MNCELYVGQILYTAQAKSPNAVFEQVTVPPVFGLLHVVTLLLGLVPNSVVALQVYNPPELAVLHTVILATSIEAPVNIVVYVVKKFKRILIKLVNIGKSQIKCKRINFKSL